MIDMRLVEDEHGQPVRGADGRFQYLPVDALAAHAAVREATVDEKRRWLLAVLATICPAASTTRPCPGATTPPSCKHPRCEGALEALDRACVLSRGDDFLASPEALNRWSVRDLLDQY